MHASGPLPPDGFRVPEPPALQTRASRRSKVLKWFAICGIVLGAVTLAIFATCIYIGVQGPDTKVLSGRQLPARFMAQIRALNLLEPEEQIHYFYSDALLNIEEGMYLLTDRKVVIYSRSYDDPALIIPFSEIVDVEVTFSESWLEDSVIGLSLVDDTYASFPVSREGGGDKRVYEALKKMCKVP
ncbi:MAG: hypothetical protein V3W34_11915 [Phycisphaerae bacterium]